jgi:hypothetical protein
VKWRNEGRRRRPVLTISRRTKLLGLQLLLVMWHGEAVVCLCEGKWRARVVVVGSDGNRGGEHNSRFGDLKTGEMYVKRSDALAPARVRHVLYHVPARVRAMRKGSDRRQAAAWQLLPQLLLHYSSTETTIFSPLVLMIPLLNV